jgi:hypothetical protein
VWLGIGRQVTEKAANEVLPIGHLGCGTGLNSIRAHLAEFGIVAPVGREGVEELLKIVADTNDTRPRGADGLRQGPLARLACVRRIAPLPIAGEGGSAPGQPA